MNTKYPHLTTFCEKNRYSLFDSIPSNWDRYWDWIPSCTTVLSIINSWMQFVKKEHMDKAITKWLDTHDKIERNILWENIRTHPQWRKFVLKEWFVPIATEERYLYEKAWLAFTGRIDAAWYFTRNEYMQAPVNIDAKTSAAISPLYYLQLTGYNVLNWYQWFILHLTDKDYKLIKVDHDKYMPIWRDLLYYFYSLWR